MNFCGLKLRKNTVIKTALDTATLLKFYKKAVCFNI